MPPCSKARAAGRPADIDALAQALSRLSQIAVAWHGRFTSIEINPLLVRPRGAGVAALDALILTTDDTSKSRPFPS